MNVQLRRNFAAVLSVAAATGLGAGGAVAAGGSMTLELKGQYAKKHRTACGKFKKFRFFHRASTVEFRGFLTPPSAKHFPVTLELERCTHGRWRSVGVRTTLGKRATGKYKGFFGARPLAPRSRRAKAVVYYSARAMSAAASSRKEYFAVTN